MLKPHIESFLVLFGAHVFPLIFSSFGAAEILKFQSVVWFQLQGLAVAFAVLSRNIAVKFVVYACVIIAMFGAYGFL